MKIILVAAMTVPDLVIGRTTQPCTCAERMPGDPHAHWYCQGTYVEECNELPWPPRTYSEDMKRFREMTTGHAIVCGRKTFESFPGGKPLPNRENIVVTSMRAGTAQYAYTNMSIARGLPGAIACARTIGVEKCFLIGGVRIFEEGLKIADELELTLVDKAWPGDVKFPGIDHRALYDGAIPWSVGPVDFDCMTRVRGELNRELTFTTWKRRVAR